MVVSSIPSPPDNAIDIGPLELRAYGVAIALGVVVAVGIARRRWAGRGGNPDDISSIAVWAVLAGLVGARVYHVITDWHRLLAGVLAGVWLARRRGLPVLSLLDAVAPAIPVAQAIGRLGNWFNQELFGGPTDLPWGLEIDPARRPSEHLDTTTFHPTFGYEALWNVALAAVLVLVERRWHPRPGQPFTGYVAGYAAGRLWVEALRIDPATEIVGLRVNVWVSGVTLLAALVVLVVRTRREAAPPEGASPSTGELASRFTPRPLSRG
jgi:prolipoprotein diacylglyceryltransferase